MACHGYQRTVPEAMAAKEKDKAAELAQKRFLMPERIQLILRIYYNHGLTKNNIIHSCLKG